MLLLTIVALIGAPASNPSGRASVQLSLDEDGRVFVCSVIASSGSIETDNATCRGLRSARFPPATDAKGKPMRSSITIADAAITRTR